MTQQLKKEARKEFKIKKLKNGKYVVFKMFLFIFKKYYKRIDNTIYELEKEHADRICNELNNQGIYLI